MKARWSIVAVLAAVLLALAFAGGNWGGAVAQTVPYEKSLDGIGTICFGTRCVSNTSQENLSIFVQTPVLSNTGCFLRQPLDLTFDPEGPYVQLKFVLNNDTEVEMMNNGELCLGYTASCINIPLSYSTTPGQVYAWVPAMDGYYGLTECR